MAKKAFSFSGVKEPSIEYTDKDGKEVSKPLWPLYSAIQESLTADLKEGVDETTAVKNAVAKALEMPDITFQQALAFQLYLMETVQELDEVKKISRLNANSQAMASNR